MPVEPGETACQTCLDLQVVENANQAIREAHAILGGMMCHRCNASCDPFSEEADRWMTRDTCPTCTAKLYESAQEDQRVRDSCRRLKNTKP